MGRLLLIVTALLFLGLFWCCRSGCFSQAAGQGLRRVLHRDLSTHGMGRGQSSRCWWPDRRPFESHFRRGCRMGGRQIRLSRQSALITLIDLPF